jgi:hypothetical protein
MTVLIIPAIGGIPLLLLTLRQWWSGLQIGLGRRTATDLTPIARIWIAVCVATAVVALSVSALLGSDDLDNAEDGVWWLLIIVLLVSAVTGAIGILTASSDAADHHLGRDR